MCRGQENVNLYIHPPYAFMAQWTTLPLHFTQDAFPSTLETSTYRGYLLVAWHSFVKCLDVIFHADQHFFPNKNDSWDTFKCTERIWMLQEFSRIPLRCWRANESLFLFNHFLRSCCRFGTMQEFFLINCVKSCKISAQTTDAEASGRTEWWSARFLSLSLWCRVQEPSWWPVILQWFNIWNLLPIGHVSESRKRWSRNSIRRISKINSSNAVLQEVWHHNESYYLLADIAWQVEWLVQFAWITPILMALSICYGFLCVRQTADSIWRSSVFSEECSPHWDSVHLKSVNLILFIFKQTMHEGYTKKILLIRRNFSLKKDGCLWWNK
jgi:hypothetical protein